MRSFLLLFCMVSALLFGLTGAFAKNNTIGAIVTFERMPDDFGQTRGTDIELNASHTFENKIVLGGSAKYYGTTISGTETLNAETTLGYAIPFGQVFHLNGSIGIGGHFQIKGAGPDFAYYVLRAGLDMPIDPKLTWNAVMVRYRNSFESVYRYETPQLATGFTYTISEDLSMLVRLERDWREGKTQDTSIEVGFKYHF